ncbi:hypothetical protein [Flavobacterium sp.]|uniref:hypothetical protein n=1 Tax=Flavobacterium sp. TaxID=239 RepID=UPI00374CBA65
MKANFYLSILSILLLSNRCAPDVTIFNIKNDSNKNILLLSKNEIIDFKSDNLLKETINFRMIKKNETKVIGFDDYELKKFINGAKNKYIFYFLNLNKSTKTILKIDSILIKKKYLKQESQDNYITINKENIYLEE